MDDEQCRLVRDVIFTLNNVTVCGAGNMDKLLGCIRALQDVLRGTANEKQRGDENA